jgi:hypothetical protein
MEKPDGKRAGWDNYRHQSSRAQARVEKSRPQTHRVEGYRCLPLLPTEGTFWANIPMEPSLLYLKNAPDFELVQP